TFTLNVVPANQAPSGVIPSPQSTTVNVPYSFNTGQYFSDPESGTLAYTATGLPNELTINPTTGVISGTPSVTATYTVTVTATDPQGLPGSSTFTLNVVPEATQPTGPFSLL